MSKKLLVPLIFLTGCVNPFVGYDGAEWFTADKKITGTAFTKLTIQFSPTDNRAAVVSPNNLGTQVWFVGPEFWQANIDKMKSAYAEPLLEELTRRGKECEVVDSTQFPHYYAIEFRYRCAGD